MTPAAADNVLLLDPETQQTLTIFYYQDSTGKQGWLGADYSPAAGQVIYPEQGVIVARKVAGDTQVVAAGPLKNGPTVAPVSVGYNALGTLKALANLTLPQLNLYTGDPSTGLASGMTPAASDNVLILQPNGGVATYFYYQDSAGNQGWLDAAYNSAQTVAVAPGSAFFIARKAPRAAFNWIIPGEASPVPAAASPPLTRYESVLGRIAAPAAPLAE